MPQTIERALYAASHQADSLSFRRQDMPQLSKTRIATLSPKTSKEKSQNRKVLLYLSQSHGEIGIMVNSRVAIRGWHPHLGMEHFSNWFLGTENNNYTSLKFLLDFSSYQSSLKAPEKHTRCMIANR